MLKKPSPNLRKPSKLRRSTRVYPKSKSTRVYPKSKSSTSTMNKNVFLFVFQLLFLVSTILIVTLAFPHHTYIFTKRKLLDFSLWFILTISLTFLTVPYFNPLLRILSLISVQILWGLFFGALYNDLVSSQSSTKGEKIYFLSFYSLLLFVNLVVVTYFS
jgi:hypothetical protein